jgi:hypothetical protein
VVTDRRYSRRWESLVERWNFFRLFPPFPPLTAFGGCFFVFGKMKLNRRDPASPGSRLHLVSARQVGATRRTHPPSRRRSGMTGRTQRRQSTQGRYLGHWRFHTGTKCPYRSVRVLPHRRAQGRQHGHVFAKRSHLRFTIYDFGFGTGRGVLGRFGRIDSARIRSARRRPGPARSVFARKLRRDRRGCYPIPALEEFFK